MLRLKRASTTPFGDCPGHGESIEGGSVGEEDNAQQWLSRAISGRCEDGRALCIVREKSVSLAKLQIFVTKVRAWYKAKLLKIMITATAKISAPGKPQNSDI